MPRKKGSAKTPGSGRRKGTPNKVTTSVREALQQAFDQAGGVEALVCWAQTDRRAFYQLWGKLLPQDVNLTGGVRLRIVEEIVDGDSPADNPAAPGAG